MYEVIGGKAIYQGKTLAEWVPLIVDDLVRVFDPVRVILFGSVARGDDGPDSDIDLLVVLPTIDRGRRHEVMKAMHQAISVPLEVQVFPTDPEEFDRRRDVIGSFMYWPAREGKVVYEVSLTDAETSSTPWITGHCVRAGSPINELPDNNHDEARRWLANAEEDLRSLRTLLADEVLPGRTGCLLAHLAIEKAFKATLIDAGTPFKKTHDLEGLYEMCAKAERLPRVEVGLLKALNPWAIDGPYSHELRDATPTEALRFAVLADSVIGAVRAELKFEAHEFED